jgi:benzodiazapine receptor
MTHFSTSRQVAGLAGWLVVSFAAAAAGALASVNAGDFYQSLERPAWAPPASIFGPVWSILYLLMAIAAWMVWRERWFQYARGALMLFLFQLALNALWSWLFFAWHKGAWSLVDIIALWILVLSTCVAFWRVRRLAAALLLPYLAWVTFATALCFAVWRRNPVALGG